MGTMQLQNGFYRGKCGANETEAIVQGIVKARISRDAPIVAHLLRLMFHDCGVNVCYLVWCSHTFLHDEFLLD